MAKKKISKKEKEKFIELIIDCIVVGKSFGDTYRFIKDEGFHWSETIYNNVREEAKKCIVGQPADSTAEIINRSILRHTKFIELALSSGKVRDAISAERSLLELLRMLGPQAQHGSADTDIIID